MLGTASSESALPRLLQKLERFGCSRQSVGLILPTGYAFNLDGTSIYMSMCTLFIANAYGVDLSWQQQMGILLIMLVTSKTPQPSLVAASWCSRQQWQQWVICR